MGTMGIAFSLVFLSRRKIKFPYKGLPILPTPPIPLFTNVLTTDFSAC
jgi:hypothetical protein